ncbi:MerR family transcriptional regulator [Pseudomonas guariconensis]|uniref:MerR family transcriptional regulator n=1 Tax=Pseudomonas guariconensis TaxID=1288410 RepID=UPI0018D7D172|nr:MerR family transcriptional regulator [Pseudomonas guariconensis]MBH3358624.1 MerR family transcriptional regulator [Pseudomonas guariconensis]MDM9594501.1 MerR family transcriptional regulator [Pseudomonas guariconensis]MDM9607331.1 MerR family transcriptional regulator [Pseudomonas guariconensis]MDM9612287.1 MerR family transcriptional regulator [Pseudomonas guariconensis]
MNIGELERRSGLGRHALRYYEKLGLIVAHRQANNYRSYSDQTVSDLAFIQSAQGAGFSLAEIGDILAARRGNSINCAQGAALVASKMAEIQAKISTLQAAYAFLDAERAKLEASAIAQGLPLIASYTR